MTTPELPSVQIADLLRMIGDKEVTIARQATLIATLSARIKELEGSADLRQEVTALRKTNGR